MNFEIPCETYSRLAEIGMRLSDGDKRQYLKSIYLERRNGVVIAIATNSKIAIIERLAQQDGLPDDSFALVVNEAVIKQCDVECDLGGQLSVVNNPTLGFASIKSTFGWAFQGNGSVSLPADHVFRLWRTWFPDVMPDQSVGHMYIAHDTLYAIACASPSGALIFPEFIDNTKPVVMRDEGNEDWFALFMPTPPKDKPPVAFREIPAWCR
jgi:hypothetical protein